MAEWLARSKGASFGILALGVVALLAVGLRCGPRPPYLVLQPADLTVMAGSLVPVVAMASSEVDPASVSLTIDGVDAVEALGLTPPFLREAGTVTIQGSDVEVSQFHYQLDPTSPPAASEIRMALNGLPLGSHTFVLRGELANGTRVSRRATVDLRAPIDPNLGGSITAASTIGDTITLHFPPGALPYSTTISLLPLATPPENQVANNFFAGVELQPHGLLLDKPVRLEVTLAQPLPDTQHATLLWAATPGVSVPLGNQTQNTLEVAGDLWHFSSFTGGIPTASEAGSIQGAVELLDILNHPIRELIDWINMILEMLDWGPLTPSTTPTALETLIKINEKLDEILGSTSDDCVQVGSELSRLETVLRSERAVEFLGDDPLYAEILNRLDTEKRESSKQCSLSGTDVSLLLFYGTSVTWGVIGDCWTIYDGEGPCDGQGFPGLAAEIVQEGFARGFEDVRFSIYFYDSELWCGTLTPEPDWPGTRGFVDWLNFTGDLSTIENALHGLPFPSDAPLNCCAGGCYGANTSLPAHQGLDALSRVVDGASLIGADGTSWRGEALVRVSDLPDGPGVLVESGIDHNADGVLSDDEVTIEKTRPNASASVAEIDPGDECAYGGLRIEYTDGDSGSRTTELACNPQKVIVFGTRASLCPGGEQTVTQAAVDNGIRIYGLNMGYGGNPEVDACTEGDIVPLVEATNGEYYYDDTLQPALTFIEILNDLSNRAPVAQVLPHYVEVVSSQLILRGDGSWDPDGDDLTFSWSIASQPGSGGSIEGGSTPNATLQVAEPGEYLVELTVSDGVLSSSDVARVVHVVQ